MVKDHSDSERGNPLPPHGLLFPISSKSSFISTMPQTGQPILWPLLHQLWSIGWNEKQLNRSTDPLHHERTLLPRSYISLCSAVEDTTCLSYILYCYEVGAPSFLSYWHFLTIRKGKEMFYLMTHSIHFILRLYGIIYMVNDHSDSERGNLLPPHELFFPISSKSSFICTIP